MEVYSYDCHTGGPLANLKEVVMRITDVSKLRGPLGELNDQLYGDNGEERLDALNLWLKGVVANLLKFVSEVSVGPVEKFKVADVLGSTGVNKDGVKIGFLGDNFKRVFVPLVEGKVEAAKLVVHQLTRYATALDIASAIPAEKRIVTIGQIYELVKAQAKGGPGPLLVNGWANIFLCYGNDGNFWLVDALLGSDGWYFVASPLDDPGRWRGVDQVFSRK